MLTRTNNELADRRAASADSWCSVIPVALHALKSASRGGKAGVQQQSKFAGARAGGREGSPEARQFARRKANKLALRNPAFPPPCKRPAGPVSKLAGPNAAGVGQRDRTSPGEPSSLGGSEGKENHRIATAVRKKALGRRVWISVLCPHQSFVSRMV